MDPTLTPWRALDDPPDRAAGSAEPAPPQEAIPRSALITGAGALLLALAAFVLAFGSNSGGTVAVDNGTTLNVLASDGGIVADSGANPLSTIRGDPALVVEIVGAIESPGVFRLPTGSRIGDLIKAAGGYGPRVDADRAGRDLNLAALLHDGDQIRVPSRDDQPAPATGAGAGTRSSGDPRGPLNLNRATAAELDALPGIGPVTAAKIIASRDERPFSAVQDLRTRKLLGAKTFANLKDLVAVR